MRRLVDSRNECERPYVEREGAVLVAKWLKWVRVERDIGVRLYAAVTAVDSTHLERAVG